MKIGFSHNMVIHEFRDGIHFEQNTKIIGVIILVYLFEYCHLMRSNMVEIQTVKKRYLIWLMGEKSLIAITQIIRLTV